MKKTVLCRMALVWGSGLMILGCCGGYPADLAYFDGFVKQEFSENGGSTLSDVVDLYVDYSTCVAEAATSDFFKATHPAIVDCNPNYYSIKGRAITMETSDRDEVYRLLRSIREVNNADLKTAVANITSSDHQAVLITDGEFFPDNIVRDNLDNPYLAPSIRDWINAGHDIYIYSEPYLESGRFNKFRYYMIFTDDDIQDNLNKKFVRSAPSMEDVLVLHLGSGVPNMEFTKKFPEVNPALSAIETPEVKDHVFIDVQLAWDDIEKYLRTGDIDQDYILRGMSIQTKDEDCYRIKEIEPVVYQLYDQYVQYADSAAVEGHLPVFDKDEFEGVEEVFAIDKKAFKKNGEVILKLSDDFSFSDLSQEHDNLFKVDFVIVDAEDNFSNNEEINSGFMWNSISRANNNAKNTSLYQSISQVLREPKMNPKRDRKVIYTVYIKMLPY